jgi:hypothetical protein
LRVGLAILEAHYGESLVSGGQPYKATLSEDRWLITPHIPTGMRGGGKAELVLSRKDGQVLSIALAR